MNPRQLIFATAILFAVAVGMSLYVWQLRRRAAMNPASVAAVQHVAPPAPGPMEKVTVWVAYDDPGNLRPQTVSIPLASGRQERAQELLRALLDIYLDKNSPHPLATGAEIHDVYLVDPGLVVIDVSQPFADGQTSGILSEELTVTSLIETVSVNTPGLMRAKILVDGQERETLAGHADLSGFYDVSQVGELAKELSAQ
jgi:Na+-transporting NADH:ubiquinone oxidoreductase subunit NqrB